jgi:HD-GYP domain-containing protein (c-di-GMP phosphodiesterase class II)
MRNLFRARSLTSRRPYKEAWSNEDAFTMLKKLADETLDRDCVEALISLNSAVES